MDATVPCDEALRPQRVRDDRLARPSIADQPCDPLVARGDVPTSWAFADPAPAEPPPLAQTVQFVTAAATTGVDAMAIVGFDAGGQVIGGRAANPASLRYVLSGEVGGWIADIAVA
jgi:hypothetical protein